MLSLKHQRLTILLLHSMVEALATMSCVSSFVFPGNKVSFHDYHEGNEEAQKIFRRGLGPVMAGSIAILSLLAVFFQQTDNPLIWTSLGISHTIALLSFVIYPVFVLGETSVVDYDLYAPDIRGLCVFHVLIIAFSVYSLREIYQEHNKTTVTAKRKE